jgi:hypothetical protein
MDIVGYATIKKDATTGRGSNNIESFLFQDCRVFEFAKDGAVLVVNPAGDELAMFEKQDVFRKFECEVVGDVICPPNLNEWDKMAYTNKVLTRKGGYNMLLKQMVIAGSLAFGKLNDNFLFAKQ